MLVKLFDWKEQTYAHLSYLNGEWERTGNVYQYGTKGSGWWQVTDLEVLEASTALRPWLSCGRWESNCSLTFWILCVGPFCQVSLGEWCPHSSSHLQIKRQREMWLYRSQEPRHHGVPEITRPEWPTAFLLYESQLFLVEWFISAGQTHSHPLLSK